MKVPILKLQGILLTSIQIDLTDEEALVFQSDVLRTINETEAQGLILDITAMDIVDSFMARVINDMAYMAKMLGAQVILCGMQPNVAIALTEMGRELIGVDTALNLDQAFEKVQRLIQGREA